VLKAVVGVIGGCLFIVALAGAKLLYQRWQAPATAGPANLPAMATTALPEPPAVAAAEHPSPAPLTPVPGSAATAGARAEGARRIAPARPSPSPGRTAPKTTPRRAPAPKKAVRGAH
jgi:hypothetical protein